MEVKSQIARDSGFPGTAPSIPAIETLATRFESVRRCSEKLCEPLLLEDYGLQAMASTSPAKWHLAHTSWFFETFILKPFLSGYREFHPQFEQLFNSYYNGIGLQYPRAQRHLLSRPSVDEVFAYRRHVNGAMLALLSATESDLEPEIAERTLLGCHHEQQHQELFFTDLKYCWFQNPIYPAYSDLPLPDTRAVSPLAWQQLAGGLYKVGWDLDDGFCFDNELPRHPVYMPGFEIADRLVSNAEYLDFIEDGGYQRPELWLADGWSALQGRVLEGTPAIPLYWLGGPSGYSQYTLHGLQALNLNVPVAHLSAYEADAYARWAGCRLPTEFEWEVSTMQTSTVQQSNVQSMGQFLDTDLVHPVFNSNAVAADNLLGRLWQWTSSAYSPYPGFKTAAGAVGEYNGKFMANQLVLRGGSCVTDRTHYRHSYRNFFYAEDQWQFTGLRLARDA